MALAFVRDLTGGSGAASGSSLSLSASPAIGNSVIVLLQVDNSSTVTGLSSPIGAFFKMGNGQINQGAIEDYEMWICRQVVATSASITVSTDNFGGTGTWSILAGIELSGGPINVFGSQASGSSTAPSLTVAPSGSGDFLVAWMIHVSGLSVSASPSSPWTTDAGFTQMSYDVAPTAAAQAASWTLNSSGPWLVIGAYLQAIPRDGCMAFF